MSERLTKQQLKTDGLVTTTADFADFASQHTTLLVAGAIALVLAIIAFNFVRAGARRADARASAMLTQAWSDYNHGQLEPAAARLTDLVRDSGGTKPGKQALLLFANIRFDQGNYKEAETYYRRALAEFKNDSILGVAAQRGLAATLENLKRYADAAAVYQELAAATTSTRSAANLTLAAARNLVKAGQEDAAAALYQKLADDPEQPRLAELAKLRLAELRFRTTAAGTEG